MLNEQLQTQIEQEAVHEASLHFHPQYSPDQNTACRINFNNGASRYASLWQAAEEKAEKYEKALREIRKWELTTGSMIKVKHLDILKDIMQTVNKALTPKTGEDEKG